MPEDPWLALRKLSIAEQMDAESADPTDLAAALRFIRRVNSWLGYTRATLRHLERCCVALPKSQPVTILDVATGSADVPVALQHWAKQRGRSVNVVGLDLHAATLAHAATFAGPDVPLVRGDALQLPFADNAFDVVMTSMFLHHLRDEAASAVLREMNRVAAHAIIAADLVRDRRAYRWISLFTLPTRPMIRHDARVSVMQAFTLEEAERLRVTAGLGDARVYPHFGHRFILAGPKTA